MLKLVKGNKKPNEIEGEVRFGIAIREGKVILTVISPTEEMMAVGIEPDGATELALAIDKAAEAIRSGQWDSGLDGDPEAG